MLDKTTHCCGVHRVLGLAAHHGSDEHVEATHMRREALVEEHLQSPNSYHALHTLNYNSEHPRTHLTAVFVHLGVLRRAHLLDPMQNILPAIGLLTRDSLLLGRSFLHFLLGSQWSSFILLFALHAQCFALIPAAVATCLSVRRRQIFRLDFHGHGFFTSTSSPSPNPLLRRRMTPSLVLTSNRTPNARAWGVEEEVHLCEAHTNASEDRATATDQSLTKFWQRVHEKFATLEGESTRNAGALQTHWSSFTWSDVTLYASLLAAELEAQVSELTAELEQSKKNLYYDGSGSESIARSDVSKTSAREGDSSCEMKELIFRTPKGLVHVTRLVKAISGSQSGEEEGYQPFSCPCKLDVRRMMKDPAWNEWFKLNLSCSQRTLSSYASLFLLLLKMYPIASEEIDQSGQIVALGLQLIDDGSKSRFHDAFERLAEAELIVLC
ncbi:hypothetical protein GQ600_6270 [Phytophthora cactorum]|nr:hypothetical protein GQ600_6270 [Phytophthora cactorum]